MTLDEIGAAIREELWRQFLAASEITPAMWAAFEDGVPRRIAEAIASEFPSVPVSAWPKVLQGNPSLTKRFGAVKVPEASMEKNRRFNIAKAHAKSPFARHCIEKSGMSQTAVAKKLHISKGRLSRYVGGHEQIPRPHAEAIEALVKWPADAKHWPGGIS